MNDNVQLIRHRSLLFYQPTISSAKRCNRRPRPNGWGHFSLFIIEFHIIFNFFSIFTIRFYLLQLSWNFNFSGMFLHYGLSLSDFECFYRIWLCFVSVIILGAIRCPPFWCVYYHLDLFLLFFATEYIHRVLFPTGFRVSWLPIAGFCPFCCFSLFTRWLQLLLEFLKYSFANVKVTAGSIWEKKILKRAL